MRLLYKIGIGAATTLVIIVFFGEIIFPVLIKTMIKKNVQLKPGGDIREMWMKVPFPLDFKVYIFNVTNSKDVHSNGDSPVLDEIGPYFFDEWKEKVNMEDNEENDTVAYNTKTRFVFNQEKSGKLTMDEIVTIPHPMMTGMLLAVAREKPSMMNLVSKAINEIFDNPESIFITASVRQILFDGLLINCTVSSFGATAVCAMVKMQSQNLDKISENEYMFSFFGMKNKTLEGKLHVKRGIKSSQDVGRVVKWNNNSEMKIWATDECNRYHGTDSTIFPPFLKKQEGLWSFAPDLCRSLGAYYVEDSEYGGLSVRVYKADLGDMSNNAADKCFCPTNVTCLKRGTMDLTKCSGAPIIVSLPHFYNCDPSYQMGVRGLHPDEEKHGIKLLFEHMTGTPVSARKRLQFSLPIQNISKVSFMQDLPEVLLPILWVEEGVSLGPDFIKKLDDSLFKILRITNIVKWVVISLSILGMVIPAALYFYKRNNSSVSPTAFTVTNVIPHLNGTNNQLRRSTIMNIVSDNKQLDRY